MCFLYVWQERTVPVAETALMECTDKIFNFRWQKKGTLRNYPFEISIAVMDTSDVQVLRASCAFSASEAPKSTSKRSCCGWPRGWTVAQMQRTRKQ